ncbi:MAG: hypothetical protein L6408_03215, partial [Nanoarchaeota archaeon]|nr:hypothetical protein [Nanoarchaeota archaeon]
MNVDNHLRAIKEGFEAIKWAIDQGIEETQTTIAFHCSNIAVNMLEIYLRKKNKITPGHIVKHEWFKSKNKTRKNLEFEFEKKKEILEL